MVIEKSAGNGTGVKEPDFVMVEQTRPPCPRCGSKDIESHGITWRCVDCRKSWYKHAEYCPHCGHIMRPGT